MVIRGFARLVLGGVTRYLVTQIRALRAAVSLCGRPDEQTSRRAHRSAGFSSGPSTALWRATSGWCVAISTCSRSARCSSSDDLSSCPVEDDGRLVGIVSKFDILKCFAFSPSQMVARCQGMVRRAVSDVMTSEFIYVGVDTGLTHVLQIMVEHRIRSIIVLDGAQKLVGIIARADVIAALKATARD